MDTSLFKDNKRSEPGVYAMRFVEYCLVRNDLLYCFVATPKNTEQVLSGAKHLDGVVNPYFRISVKMRRQSLYHILIEQVAFKVGIGIRDTGKSV